jgi:PPOX class probable F420-dependent enzyme
MIDGSTPLGGRILERLQRERVIWMTTVDGGVPQPAPVWFLYERLEGRERILVYTRPEARRVANLAANPAVAFNFNCTPGGDEVHVIRGRARIARELPQVPDCRAYVERYRDLIGGDDTWNRTVEGFAALYAVPIEVTDLSVWGW